MISSEGGVGRGLEPLTDMLNTENKGQGGNKFTTYAPAYSFATSERRGFILNNHTEIGNLDFRESSSLIMTLWKCSSMNMSLVLGKSMKQVVSGITHFVGRMKKLPKWTQEGAIVGLQGNQSEVLQNYKFLKDQQVPIKAVWMQNWVGTYSFPEGVRLLWNWQLNRNQYPDWDQIVSDWAKDGVRPMVYMNPYFANLTGHPDIRDNLFEEADSKGYFLKNSDGESY